MLVFSFSKMQVTTLPYSREPITVTAHTWGRFGNTSSTLCATTARSLAFIQSLAVEMAGETQEEKPAYPWPYLSLMFEILEMRNDSCDLNCLLCSSWSKFISAFKNSLSDLRKHTDICTQTFFSLYINTLNEVVWGWRGFSLMWWPMSEMQPTISALSLVTNERKTASRVNTLYTLYKPWIKDLVLTKPEVMIVGRGCWPTNMVWGEFYMSSLI